MTRALYDLAFSIVIVEPYRNRRILRDHHIYFEPSSDYSTLEIESKVRELHDKIKADIGKRFGKDGLVVKSLERKADVPKKIEIKREDGDWILTTAGVILKDNNVYKI